MILKLYRSVATRFKVFTNKEEMNDHIRAHIFAAGRKLHKNARAVLYLIARHSCVVSGVSWLNEETIAELLSVCTRTVKRAIDRIISLNIGRNEIVEVNGAVLRYFILHKFEVSTDCLEVVNDLSSGQSSTSLTETGGASYSEVTETVQTVETGENDPLSKNVRVSELDSSYTPSSVPTQFTQEVSPFFNSASEIYALWQKVRIAYNKSALEAPISSITNTAIKAFKETMFAVKYKKCRSGFGAYFYGTVLSMLVIDRRKEVDLIPYWARK